MKGSLENGATTIAEILRARARERPDAVAYALLSNNGVEASSWTYADLHARALAVAERLAEVEPAAGGRALLLYPPGLDFLAGFFGCLYARWVAVPAMVPRSVADVNRTRSFVMDARPTACLTTAALAPSLSRALDVPGATATAWLGTDSLAPSNSERAERAPSPEDLAYLQYTSGSTSQPKGVMVRHRNIIANARALVATGGLEVATRFVGWLPVFHDMGLMSVVTLPLYVGVPSLFMSPMAFLQRPGSWLAALSRHRASHTGGPNFAYDLCLRRVSDELARTLDLSGLRVAFTGSEPVRAATIDAFSRKFAPSGFAPSAFFPCYGMAEATLFVTGGRSVGQWRDGLRPTIVEADRAQLANQRVIDPSSPDAPVARLVSCGKPWSGHHVIVVEPDARVPLPERAIGEVWVSGPSVSDGYFERPGDTARTFGAFTASDPPQGPFLRTGDLGTCIRGELFLTGRLKDLLIVRGRNLHPSDLEEAAEASHAALAGAYSAAFAVETGEAERVVLVHGMEVAPDPEGAAEILQCVRRAVVETHGINLHAICLVRRAQVPRTTSGKVQRSACRLRFLSGDLALIAEWRAPEPGGSDEAVVEPSRLAAAVPNQPAMLVSELVRRIAARTGVDASEVDPNTTFSRLGLDSLQVVGLTGELSELLGTDVSPALAYDHPTPAALARALTTPKDRGRVSEVTGARPAGLPVAVVGMGCRLPGAASLAAFWALLEGGRQAISRVPVERWGAAVADALSSGGAPPSTFLGGFVDGIENFDAAFFDMSPQEAAHTDPQQRLLLEVAVEAIEDAGIRLDELAGTQTGVFIGISGFDFGRALAQASGRAGTGVAHSIAANRLSYFFDLRGPSVAVDTACSSSLVAVHMAIRALRAGECDLALVGGVNAILSPECTIAFSEAGMLAADGMCKTFDARADGYVRGEGCGVVVLRRLDDAIFRGDRVRSILRGSALSQNGRSNGLTAPNGLAQQSAIRRALADAGVEASQIDYVEAHGSGTPLGDVIEAQALAEVFREARSAQNRLGVGSVKANIGHLEAAAGIAGLLKIVLTLERGLVPEQPGFRQLDPRIGKIADGFSIRKPGDPAPPRPCLGAVSSFGFGGTNAHVIVQASPGRDAPAQALYVDPGALRPELFVFSAQSERALRDLAGAYARRLAELDPSRLAALCASTRATRSHFRVRLAIVACNCSELLARLEGIARGDAGDGCDVRSRQTAIPELFAVFPAGEGAIESRAVEQLAQTQPAIAAAWKETMHAARRLGLDPLSSSDASEARAKDRVLLCGAQYALFQLWQSWGLRCDGVVSCGGGARAAAVAAGGAGLDEALAAAFAGGWVAEDETLDASSSVRVFRLPGGIPDSRGWSVHRPCTDSRAVAPSDVLPQGLAFEVRGHDAVRAPLASVLHVAAALYMNGIDFDWRAVDAARPLERIELPTYPFQRRRCWPAASALRKPW
ncbi:MAG: beta-ketoacyl synthase N-terminal-like domain-containing protein [Polyangiaceae bacterium]